VGAGGRPSEAIFLNGVYVYHQGDCFVTPFLAMTCWEDTMPRRTYCVYIMTNRHHTVLYTGMTNHLERRVHEHKDGRGSQFTRRYHVTKRVYVEEYAEVTDAIAREKQIKAGSRQKKLDLISDLNPEWQDLSRRFLP
jgi:putative endonuclease